MELRALRYFAAVVESGSLTAAAARLHLSQPSLSVAIGKLETEAGVPLLVRSSRGVEPTGAGRFLLEASSRVLGEVDGILSTLRRYGAGTLGSLTMAAVPVLMWRRVPELLRAHAAEAPGVEIRLVDPPPWTAMDLVQERSADLAAILVADAPRFAARHRGAFELVDWGEVPLVGVLPPGETDAPDPLPLAAFEARTLVLPHRTSAVPSLPEAVEAALLAHGVAPAAVRTAPTIQTSIPLIEAGLACGILPDPDRTGLARFDVVVRRLEPEPDPLRALVLARPGASAEPALGRLLARISAPAEQIAQDPVRNPI
ncbi:LysR family transcriptional regulator [Agromyces archimandritae]|uniref:LysR family transcriptional regulator n=1 Tax=Agromyces archimandritae TaxID=2781962 RepID=A0A975INB0_9MICO|nr:LysR family transcriptional regulator [Agromyces archimandritae]QTX04432.1 LysR family transcriptional regulator [Agromyces archimandritae]